MRSTVTGATIFAPNLSIWGTLRVASSAPDSPLGKPMKFSILDDPEARPPGPRRAGPGGGTQSAPARLGTHPPALLSGDQQLLTQSRDLVQDLAQSLARNTHEPRRAPRDAGHDHGPAGKQINVSGELAGPVRHDMPILIRRIQ